MLDKNSAAVRRYLEDHGIKQIFVSRKSGINQKTLCGMLCGHYPMSDEVRGKICKVLEISPKDLFGGS